ncbi:hypothetical protein CYLTODRAFT_494759 [Cylindrobasidium torrendii FP15055 ss-10]|uniref:MYND-type domain-containing protein n=1 Tax=Cylindrobasidium torrendii FP15055 ss-10 TaxID=1314674 RepID=A0A0D7AVN0_9AGAR|nr:hypothetical protein CYLTODRAFT_494759 [Cylindrobasidium torrendii FP15055 ss-10]
MARGKCYFCSVRKEDLRRCSRCRLATYCSEECQRRSWQASHKRQCIPHASLVDSNGKLRQTSELQPDELMEIELDRQLSKWLELWRSVLCTYAAQALDMAGNGQKCVVEKCLVLRITRDHFVEEPWKIYKAVDAFVESTQVIDNKFPELRGVVADQNDLTRLRFLVIAETPEAIIRRVRLFQWDDLGVYRYLNAPKPASKALAQAACADLKYGMDNLSPEETEVRATEKELRLRRTYTLATKTM